MTENLNEDMLIHKPYDGSQDRARDRAAKQLQEQSIAKAKKETMAKAVKAIYSAPVKRPITESPFKNDMQVRKLKVDGHVIEIVYEGKTMKVASDIFADTMKGYVSELVKEVTSLRAIANEQERRIRNLTSRQDQQQRNNNDNGASERLVREVQDLKSQLARALREIKNDQR